MALYDFGYGINVLLRREIAKTEAADRSGALTFDAGDTANVQTAAAKREWIIMILALAAIIVGVIFHWLWEILVSAAKTGVLDFGNSAVIIARVGIAIIVGILNFAGIWKQLEGLDPKLRLFFAITQGFALDALASPIASNISPTA
jgi:hypothetical protein